MFEALVDNGRSKFLAGAGAMRAPGVGKALQGKLPPDEDASEVAVGDTRRGADGQGAAAPLPLPPFCCVCLHFTNLVRMSPPPL